MLLLSPAVYQADGRERLLDLQTCCHRRAIEQSFSNRKLWRELLFFLGYLGLLASQEWIVRSTVPLVKLRGGFLFVVEEKGGKDWPVVDVTYSFEILVT